MDQKNYYASDGEDEFERKRLSLLEQAYDPNSIRQLESLGVSEGWSCLEIGAGGGSIAQWLANKVGASGKVVATDMNTRFLRHLSTPNIEVREHNILTDLLETGMYDLVHARMVLQHLREPEKALKKMKDALRPGGWIFIEDADFGSFLVSNLTDPSLDIFVAAGRRYHIWFQEKGIMDPYFGRKVIGLVEELGFLDVDHQGWTRVIRGGEPLAQYLLMVWQYLREQGLTAGLVTQEECEEIERCFLDASTTILDMIVFGAWGRKPNG